MKSIEKIESVFFIQKIVFSIKISYSLKNFVIFNSDFIIYIFNEIIWFLNFYSAQSDNFFWTNDHKISIQKYDNINIEIQSQKSDNKKFMRFYDIAFCKNFTVNLMSFHQLHKLNYWWDNRSEFNHICKINQNYIIIIIFIKLHKQNMLKHIFNNLIKMTFFN